MSDAEIVAKELAFSIRQPNDVSRDAEEYWHHMGSAARATWLVVANAAIANLTAPQSEVDAVRKANMRLREALGQIETEISSAETYNPIISQIVRAALEGDRDVNC